MNNIRNFFPILEKITFLDNAALSQKPLLAIEREKDFYLNYAVSTRTSESPIGIQNNLIITQVKDKVRKLLKIKNDENVIFTSGSTDSLNKLALMLENYLNKNDEIIISEYNHSSNIAPWIKIANTKGAKVIFSDDILSKITNKTKLITLSQINNSFEYKLDLKKIYEIAYKKDILVINDAAQAIVSEEVNFSNCDAIVFSTNKFYGPTGFGILAFNEKIKRIIEPIFLGGGMVDKIDSNCDIIFKKGELAFEPGTPNLAAIHMFNGSLDFFNTFLGYKKSKKQLLLLSNYLFDKLKEIPQIKLYNSRDSHIIIFNIQNINAQDIAHYLGTKNIYVRSGIFCAQYLKNKLDESSFVRISLGVYNNKKDCDNLIKALKDEIDKGGNFLVI
ncbi:Cysteine desulfurase, SufS subfamily [Mycoplasmopsis meleagridis]|uniref:Cysteine desulfurase, SufS subfamily n=1 Tax=Mycoplasmopsis meleagridis ATCC 25294 TaxID=1264554 RepID=A0A0F5H0M2_9BACT|nr:aminotransferase class V-fold PLP-dependent enzyme [Mycoplasmopsis meleagridis]KKB26829.1 Cysteine desulfurase, SufS subfamily [Mycoplasmopsis meleagridis ATCC 25294]OAD18390.1 Cysteine desulfurase, SufS subfamily [Mycoplasmopsis meleagridis]VEU77432.1 Cysteine desulfurase [Mycoplasmopsis meleagridis]